MCKLVSAYPSFTREQVYYRLAMCEGWAWYAWSVETDAWRETERKSKGYIGQEIERLLKTKQKAESRKQKLNRGIRGIRGKKD